MNKEKVESMLTGAVNNLITFNGKTICETSLGYYVFIMVLDMHGKYISIDTKEVDDSDYILYISVMDNPPILGPNLHYTPLMILSHFPHDCRLDDLLRYGVSSVTLDSSSIVDSYEGGYFVGKSLILKSGSGSRFEFIASEEILGSIEIRQIT